MLLIAVSLEDILHCKLTTCSIDWNKHVSNGTLLCYKDKTDLSDTVGTTTESLRRYSEVVCGQKIISAPLQKDSSLATQPPQTTNERNTNTNSPVLSCSESNLSPLSATFVMFSLIMPTVSSICACMAAVFALPPLPLP